MDLSVFSQESFDPKDWINEVFKRDEASQNRDINQYATSLVMRLQLAIQEVNGTLEDTSQQVVTSLPRVLRDLDSLGHEAEILKNQMNNVRQDIEKVEQSTAASMQSLVVLDTLKSRLAASSQALREADNWTTLSTDIEEVMDSGDFETISSKLLALQSCLGILTHVPDYEDRVAHLEGLKVRLEALASPYIVAAFNQHNLEESLKYAKILTSLGRGAQLKSYYHKCERGQMLTAWRSGVEGHQLSGPPVWLTSFYDKLLTLLKQQMQWCGQVFEGTPPALLLSELISDTLTCLDPPISQVLSAAAKQQEDLLPFLTSVKEAGDHFLNNFQHSISSSNTTSSLGEELEAMEKNIVVSVYSSLEEELSKYQQYEEAFLLSHLITADLTKPDMSETLHRLRDYCSKIPTQAELATQRCIKLSNGWLFPALISAINTYIEEFMSRVAQSCRHVEQQKASITDDWTVFSTCLALLHTAGELLVSVDQTEHALATVFSNAVAKITWESRDPFMLTPEILLSSQQIKQLKLSIRNIVDEDGRFLESSITAAQGQCQMSVDVALTTIMAPVSDQLSAVPNLPSWGTRQGQSTTLSVSFSPQEYITQIGQYLLTLPQHLEPLLVNHSPALNRALQQSSSSTGPGSTVVSESEVSATDFLINSVGQTTCKLYTEAILKINEISTVMITQLTTDIDYICNILEDLNVTCCEPLDKLNALLKIPAQDYGKASIGNTPRLVAAVRQMRNIAAQS